MQLNNSFLRKSVGLFLLLFCLLLVGCDSAGRLPLLRPDAVILAFGDSLTRGSGASAGQSYPAQLQQLIRRKVINAGVPGELSAEGARRLPGLLDKHQPDLLLLCHGGNDLLRKLDRQQLRDNLRRMVEAADQRDIQVILIAVPQLGLLPADAALYQQLAAELQLPLVTDILAELLADPQYKSDSIHPNAAGYRKFAEAVADQLKTTGAL